LEGEVLKGFFPLKYKTLIIWELNNYIREGFWGFERVYMDSSNFIYVVIIFLKLKIY